LIRSLTIGVAATLLFGCTGQSSDGSADNGTSAAVAQNVKAPAFDTDSAFALLKKQVAFGPRVPGTPGHEAQLAWMLEYLRARADSVTTQTITKNNAGKPVPQMTNVFARFNPAAQQRVLLLAHWDTRPKAIMDRVAANRSKPIPGANDGASGVAVLLVLADMFKNHPPPIGVDLLFTDGEDWEEGDMYIGATYFAANLPSGYAPLYGVLIDMIADQNPVFPIEQYSQDDAPEVVDRVWRAAADLGLSDIFPRTLGPAVGDDHGPLNAAGIHTIDIIDGEFGAPVSGTFGEYWHTMQDDVSHTSPKGLDAVGRVLAHLVYNGG
jgi:Zn-dependent M28 family amino/carboxypeptidase